MVCARHLQKHSFIGVVLEIASHFHLVHLLTWQWERGTWESQTEWKSTCRTVQIIIIIVMIMKKTSLSDLYVSIGLLIYANCSIITLCKPSKYFLLVNNRGLNAFTVCFVRSNKVWTHIKDAALQRILFPAGRLPLAVTPEEPGLWILQRTAEAPTSKRLWLTVLMMRCSEI